MTTAIIVIVIVVILSLVAGALVWYRKTRETDPARIEAKADLKEKTSALKAAKTRRERDVSSAQKELNKTTKARDNAIKRIQREISDINDPRGRRLGSYQGVTLYQLQISTPHGSGSVAGVHASVDSQVSKRITATRLVTIGVFALAAKKKTGAQFLSIDGPDIASVVQCPVDDAMKAREFAVKINNAARSAQALIDARPTLIAVAEARLTQERDTTAVDRCRERLAAVQQNPQLLSAIESASAAVAAAQQRFNELTPASVQSPQSDGAVVEDVPSSEMTSSASTLISVDPTSWQSDVELSLATNEVVCALVPITHNDSNLDGLAVTNRRILAFDSTMSRTVTPPVSINLRAVESVDWRNALSGKRLQVTTRDGADILVGTVADQNVEYAQAAVDSAVRDSDIAASGVWMDKPPLRPRLAASR